MDGEGLQPASNEIESNPRLDQILQEMDKKFEGKEGLKPSQAWEYKQQVIAKYQLPENDRISIDPTSYIHNVEALLKDNNIQVRPKHEFQNFFNENPTARAVNFEPNVFRDSTVVVANASENNFKQLKKRAKDLSHEAVHALQDIRYPSMPYEEKEREAYYYECLTPEMIIRYKDNPEELFAVLDDLIDMSVTVDQKTGATVDSR